jgi:hypothetical protein
MLVFYLTVEQTGIIGHASQTSNEPKIIKKNLAVVMNTGKVGFSGVIDTLKVLSNEN